MNEKEIRKIYSALILKRNWYYGTNINTKQAYELKRRFLTGELSIGRMMEVLMECGYEVEVKKGKEE